MLARGRAGLEEFSDKAIGDPEVLALAAKVRYELDPAIDYPRHFSGHVRVKLRDGTVLEENQAYPRGGLESPLVPAEIEEKFRANAALALPRENVERLIAVLRSLEELPSVEGLASLLAPN
ncbi:MAG TPA: hypothetical protein DCZ05_16890 [Deltaproteobacteria bacterium]|nr:hypothetical protein [Deltaproteobacteria bacterium]